uniref:Uncharacterized protein n=1 Tax=Leersia perrieri TaxID=77586 RepID=A0A0D9V3R0_9ORYZ
MTASAVVAPPQIRQFSTAAAAVAPLPTSPVSPMRPRIRNDVVTSVLAALSPHRRPLCGCNFFGVEEAESMTHVAATATAVVARDHIFILFGYQIFNFI